MGCPGSVTRHIGCCRARDEPRPGHEHPAGGVRNLQGSSGRGRPSTLFEQDGPARGGVGLSHRKQLLSYLRPQEILILKDGRELVDVVGQFITFRLQFDARESRQAPQGHVEDVRRLLERQVEDGHELFAGGGGIVTGANELDNLVNVQDGDEESIDEVLALHGAPASMETASAYDVSTMIDEDGQQLVEAQGARLALDERHGINGEVVLQRRESMELLKHGLRIDGGRQLDHEAKAVIAVGQVDEIGDAAELLRGHQILDALHDALGADAQGEFRDDNAASTRGDLLDACGGADAEGSAPGGVGLADTVEAQDHAATGEVGTGDEANEVLECGLRVEHKMTRSGHNLTEVVRSHRCGHADGDSSGSIDKECGEAGREDGRLQLPSVVVGHEVHDVFIEPRCEGNRRGCQAAFGVAHGCGAIVG